ncbi:hypothetical protein AVEN_220165-1 [Araneus ventricosus]|uniref:Uncharacterized protein n=1 Tax=Araneus ventricosus TaxID=182803 RepID=A0A4Y2RK08_ARAVE|nr:hypothetical protein AVEN_220165-1 [Araneus ventricosus]
MYHADLLWSRHEFLHIKYSVTYESSLDFKQDKCCKLWLQYALLKEAALKCYMLWKIHFIQSLDLLAMVGVPPFFTCSVQARHPLHQGLPPSDLQFSRSFLDLCHVCG